MISRHVMYTSHEFQLGSFENLLDASSSQSATHYYSLPSQSGLASFAWRRCREELVVVANEEHCESDETYSSTPNFPSVLMLSQPLGSGRRCLVGHYSWPQQPKHRNKTQQCRSSRYYGREQLCIRSKAGLLLPSFRPLASQQVVRI